MISREGFVGLIIRFFGTFRIEGGGWSTSQFGTLRAAKLLSLLALSKRGRMMREDLADALWPDDFYDATRLRLRQEVFRLKKALESHGSLITSSAEEIGLESSDITTDLQMLQTALAIPVGDPRRRPALAAAIEETRGPFLRGWDDIWVIAERGAAEELRLHAITALGEALLADALPDQALDVVSEAVKEYPTNEGLRMIAVQAHAVGGSLAAAVNEFQQFKRVLAEQGKEPTAAAQDIASNIQSLGFPLSLPNSPQYSVTLSMPVPIERLYGRTKELADLAHLLGGPEPSRCITLIGPGGIGKSRLAVEAGHRSAGSFDQAGFVSLAELEHAKDLPAFVLERLGLHTPPSGDLLTYLARSLGGGRTLLIFDGTEHLAAGLSGFVRALLAAAPGLTLLITSRVTLSLGGEHVISVGPLKADTDGRNMLSDLWALQRTRGTDTARDQDALTRLAQRLDGYPLALKLAAARLRFLSPADLESQLQQSVATLKASSSDLEERHRSLDAALRESYDSLTTEEKRALGVCAAFQGGITIERIGESLGPDGLDCVERLFDRSLLMLDDRSERVRFRMLGPIREFVGEASGSEEANKCTSIFLKTCTEWVSSFGLAFDQPMTLAKLRQLDDESENLQHAAAVAGAQSAEQLADFLLHVWTYDVARGRHSILLGHLEKVWPHLESLPKERQASLYLARATVAIGRSQEHEAERYLDLAEAIATEPRVKASIGVLRAHNAGRLAMQQKGNLDDAAKTAEDSVALAQSLGNDFLVARARTMAGYVAQFRNRNDEAIRFLSPAFEALKRMGEVGICGTVGLAFSESLRVADRIGEADLVMQEAATIVLQGSDPVRVAHMYETQGRVALERGKLADAEWCFREALTFHTNIDNRYQMAYQLSQLAHVHAEQGLEGPSRDCLIQAAQYWRDDENLASLCDLLNGVARIYVLRGDEENARTVLAFSRAFEAHWRLVLITADLEDRARLESKVGVAERAFADLSVDAAMKWFLDLAVIDA